jgi:hypothetical protein
MDALKYFTKLKVIQALMFLAIPLVLMEVEGEILNSISAYAYYTPMPFALLLTLAGAMFLYDGYVVRKRIYNVYVGLALFGVVLFPHLDHPYLHYTCAVIFFIGSVFNMIYFSNRKQWWINIPVALLVLFGMFGCFVMNWYSIFWAEWMGMVPISVHFILEATNKID